MRPPALGAPTRGTGQGQAVKAGETVAIKSLGPTGKDQARWTMRWKIALNAFDITFHGRLPAARQ
ncbi:hypothetical protein [Streptomyces sp. NPDC001770]